MTLIISEIVKAVTAIAAILAVIKLISGRIIAVILAERFFGHFCSFG